MKKKTKTKTKTTALDRLTAKLRTALRRETTNIIEIGKLLFESHDHLEHGEWLPWLEKNFDLTERTARRYTSAAVYVECKSDTVSDFSNLAAGVLYDLAAGRYNEQEEAAILAASRKGRVDQDAARAICEKLAPPDDDAGDADAPPDAADDAGDADDSGETAAAEDPEITAILDGAPPAVPPPAPIPPPTDFALRDFDQAIDVLKRLMTKPSAKFAGTAHGAADLESVEAFIRDVTKKKAASEPAPIGEVVEGGE